jgi:hypothetical protein
VKKTVKGLLARSRIRAVSRPPPLLRPVSQPWLSGLGGPSALSGAAVERTWLLLLSFFLALDAGNGALWANGGVVGAKA